MMYELVKITFENLTVTLIFFLTERRLKVFVTLLKVTLSKFKVLPRVNKIKETQSAGINIYNATTPQSNNSINMIICCGSFCICA